MIKYFTFAILIAFSCIACQEDEKEAFDTGQEELSTQAGNTQNGDFSEEMSPQTTGVKDAEPKDAPPAERTRPKPAEQSGQPSLGGIPKNRDSKLARNRAVYFFDHVGGTDEIVYDAIKGQPYYKETRILVYATDVLMEGTAEYDRIENTMQSTRVDDRIFIWVHLDDQRNVVFVKKLISDNIKNTLDEANYIL